MLHTKLQTNCPNCTTHTHMDFFWKWEVAKLYGSCQQMHMISWLVDYSCVTYISALCTCCIVLYIQVVAVKFAEHQKSLDTIAEFSCLYDGISIEFWSEIWIIPVLSTYLVESLQMLNRFFRNSPAILIKIFSGKAAEYI